MKLAWFSAALSTVLLSGVCAHAQEAGVFDKWLNERSPTCVPVSEFKRVSTVIELTPEQFQFVRASLSRCHRCREPCHLATRPSWRTPETPSCSHRWPADRLARVFSRRTSSRHSGLHSQGNPARQGRRRLANDGREHPLIEVGIGTPVF